MKGLYLLLFLITSWSINAIAQADSIVEMAVLDSVLKRYETPMQHYKVSSAFPSKITGKKGLIVEVNPAFFYTVSGKPLADSIDVELKELETVEEAMRDRVAHEGPFVFRAMYYLMIRSNGEQLNYKLGQNAITLRIAKKINYNGRVSLCYHDNKKLQGLKQTRFKEYFDTSEVLKMSDDEKERFIKERLIDSVMYDPVEVYSFGWIENNNSREHGRDARLVYLTINFDQSSGVKYVSAYLAYKDINTINYSVFKTSGTSSFPGVVLLDERAALIVIGIKRGKAYTYRSDFTPYYGQKLFVKLKYTPKKDIPALFTLNK